jgi:hypothetical protein
MKMKTRLLFLGVAIAAVALAQPLGAATDTKVVSVTAVVGASARLELSRLTIAFPDTPDVDANPSIAATGGAITVTAKGKTTGGATISLTVLAGGNLVSGSDTIAISNVTWVGGGAGFEAAGTMNSTVAQSVASWTNSGIRTGTQTFALANSWDYAVGNYTASATYTLTAP